MPPFDGGPVPAVVGHRGAPRRARENTPASFAAAVAEGATWVELDARRSADGVVVLHHDPETSDGVPLVERTAGELLGLGVFALDTVLDALPARVGVDVELKNLPGEADYDEHERLAALIAAVLDPRTGERPLLLSSFNPVSALAAAAALDGVPAGLLSGDGLAVDAAAKLAVELGFQAVCPHVDAPGTDAAGLAAAHEAGLAVLVWPVDNPARARELAAAGVEALCTNDPGGLVEALRDA